MDEFDKESRNLLKSMSSRRRPELGVMKNSREDTRTLKTVTLKILPNLWMGLEFALSVKTININSTLAVDTLTSKRIVISPER